MDARNDRNNAVAQGWLALGPQPFSLCDSTSSYFPVLSPPFSLPHHYSLKKSLVIYSLAQLNATELLGEGGSKLRDSGPSSEALALPSFVRLSGAGAEVGESLSTDPEITPRQPPTQLCRENLP